MKTFKLIKKYPDSMLEVGDILIFNDNQFSVTKKFEQFDYNYSLKDCIGFPEHWEEVIEKDYEILLYYKQNQIKSIKRLSDGEIFTIDDKITRVGYTNSETIRGFNLADDFCLVSISDIIDKGYISSKGVNINAVQHAKIVLFTTKDDVDIYLGDKYSVIDILENKYTVIHNTTISGSKSSRYILISTKEKAEEYILMNKPCISINDIENIAKGTNIMSLISKSLREFVKSKL